MRLGEWTSKSVPWLRLKSGAGGGMQAQGSTMSGSSRGLKGLIDFDLEPSCLTGPWWEARAGRGFQLL